MDKEELSGVLGELDEALLQVEKPIEKPIEENRQRVWKQGEWPKEPAEQKKSYRPARRLSGLLRPSDSLLASFFVPVILLIVIFALKGIFPFGTETFLRTDMYHQYAPFFSEFQHKLKEGGSLFYSWNVGMGINFTALYAYYLASPFNWLLFFCPDAYVIEFMTILVVLKTGLSGLTFTFYLRKHRTWDHEPGKASEQFGVCYFGIFYAMSGYMAAYSWNIMWLDCIVLFPLIMLGLEQLVQERKGLLYCITLGISILSNYYISIMICMFMVIYYICLLILEKRKSIKELFFSLLRFSVYSLLAGGLAACVLLPEIAALQSTASGDVSFPKTIEQYFPILDMLARHIGCVQTETGLNHWPNLYCGVAVYLLFILYLTCERIPAKEKAVYCTLLLFFFASFSVNVLNFIWHGLHYPNSLPCRQSFLYIFLLLVMCSRVYSYLNEIPRKRIAMALAVSVAFVLIAQKNLAEDEAYHFAVFYGAILFLALYAGLIYFYKNPRRSVTTAALLGLYLVGIEAGLNMAVTSIPTTGRTAYVSDNSAIRMQTQALLEQAKEKGGFFRFERKEARTKNDGAWMNFPSVSLFSSLAHADMTDLFKKLGCEGSTNAYSMIGSTPVTDSLFSVRYSLYNGEEENPRLIPISNYNEVYLYENPYTLPVGFLLPDIVEHSWDLEKGTPADVQNHLAELLDAPPAFEYVYGTSSGDSLSFTAESDGEYYIAVKNKKVKSVDLTVQEVTQTIKNVNRGFLLETGSVKAGDTITVEIKEGDGALNASVYRFYVEGLAGIYDRLNENPLQITEWEEDFLAGTIEAGDGGTLFLSIPYDEGWSLTVDGEKTETRKVLQAFTGVTLSGGSHTITLSYEPRGLKEGAAVSAVSLFLLLLSAVVHAVQEKRKKENRKKK